MSDNTNSPTHRVREQLRSLENQGEDYIWRTAKAAGDAWDECERRLSAAVAEQQAAVTEIRRQRVENATQSGVIDTLQARVRVLESAIRGFDDAIAKLQGVKLHEATCRALNDATAAGRAALTPPSTLAIDAAAYGGPLPPADPQGDPYRDALAELVAAADVIEKDDALELAVDRARALLSGADAQQEGKS